MMSQKIFNMNNIAKNSIFQVLSLASMLHKNEATIYISDVHRLHGGPLFSAPLCNYDIVEFSVPFDTLYVILETI